MNTIKILGVALLIAGVLALMHGGFSYTKESHGAKVGALELQFDERETVKIPDWAGAGMIALGGGLLLFAGRRK